MKRYARPALAVVFVAMLATPAIIRRFGDRAAPSAATADAAGLRYGFRLTEAVEGVGHLVRPRGADARRQAGAHHAAGGVDGRGGRGRRRRRGRSRRPLRHEQQGRIEEPSLSQPRRRHVRGGRRAVRRRRPQPPARPACRWAPCSATTTTTGSRICSCTDGAGPSCSATTAGRAFTRVTDAASLPAWANINTAVWLDFDRDGRLDLFLGGYYPERVNLWNLADTKIMPESFEYANNGGRKYLYRNLGGGRFEEVSAKVGLISHPLGARGGRRRSARHRLPRSVHRQRLRRVRALHQRRRPLPRSRPRGRRRLRAEERHERVGRRRAQPGQASPSTSRTSPRKASCSRATTCGCPREDRARCRSTRTWRGPWASTWADGASARSSATSTTTASSTSIS